MHAVHVARLRICRAKAAAVPTVAATRVEAACTCCCSAVHVWLNHYGCNVISRSESIPKDQDGAMLRLANNVDALSTLKLD